MYFIRVFFHQIVTFALASQLLPSNLQGLGTTSGMTWKRNGSKEQPKHNSTVRNNRQVANCWFGLLICWSGILGAPLSNNPFHRAFFECLSSHGSYSESKETHWSFCFGCSCRGILEEGYRWFVQFVHGLKQFTKLWCVWSCSPIWVLMNYKVHMPQWYVKA